MGNFYAKLRATLNKTRIFLFMLTLGIAIFCSIAALIAGFIDAVAGGGGLLTIPALLISGIPPQIALGTNKIGACCGTFIALINFTHSHLVRWKMVIYGLGFSLVGSWIGSLLALGIDPHILGKIMVFLLPIGMIVTLLPQKKNANQNEHLTGWKFWVLLPVICMLIGCYDGFFGPATGSFLILALHWALGMGLLKASATAKAFNLGSNVSGAVTFMWHGAVYWPLALLLAAFLMIGNWLGSRLAIKVGAQVVRRFLLLSLALLLVTLLWQYFISS